MTEFERAVMTRIKQLGFAEPEREYKIIPDRKFRADFAWPQYKIALEAEGGVYQGGWHQSIGRYESDCEKYSLAAIEGWIVIRCSRKQFDDGRALHWLARALEVRKREAA